MAQATQPTTQRTRSDRGRAEACLSGVRAASSEARPQTDRRAPMRHETDRAHRPCVPCSNSLRSAYGQAARGTRDDGPRSRALVTCFLVALSLLLALPAFAGVQHPNNERGFSPEKSFAVGDLDNVSIFNGGLTITIPIGIGYPVGGGFSYQLTLVYNSNLWDWEQVSGGPGQEQSQPRPNLDANAGFGWTLSLGNLIPPNSPPRNDSPDWLYASADGAEHRFWDTLHLGETNSSVRWYTRDNSYLRMIQVSGTKRTIEFPDGTLHTFDLVGTVWHITKIEDRFGNNLAITYQGSKTTLTDSTGRSHEITTSSFTVDGLPTALVTKVELAAFGGGTAIYTLNYAPSLVERPCPFIPGVFPDTHQFYLPPQADVQLLTSITLPDGSRYRMPASEYITSVDSTTCKTAGALKQMQLPTLGYIEWDWAGWSLPSGNEPEDCGMPVCGPFPDPTPWLQSSSGVIARRVLDANANVQGTWTYASQLVQSGDDTRPIEKVTTVITPLGDKTEHFFSAYIAGNLPAGSEALPEHYSLPFTTKVNDGSNPKRYLSQKIYDGNGSNLKRTVYVRYDWDPFDSAVTFGDLENRSWDFNRRVQSQRTVFNAASVQRDVNNSNFDGLGHYRSVQTSGTTSGGNTRTETTNYNPAAGSFPGSFNLPNTWLLNLYDHTRQAEGSAIAYQSYCFDAATGFLRGERRFRVGSSRDHDDVIVLYESSSDGQGNVTAETYYGGDNANAPTGQPVCTVTPSIWSYRQAHTYAFGTRATTQYESAVGQSIGFLSLDQTIDASTGLPSSSKDTAEIRTDYEYEEQGRIEWIKPEAGHGAWVNYLYDTADSAGDLARVVVFTRPNGSTGGLITKQEVHFDALGRVHLERDWRGGTAWNTVETRYDAMGNKTDVSTPYAGASATGWTRFDDYDPFGRAKKITAPDGLESTLNYFGNRTVNRTVRVAAGTGANPSLVNATTREDYDKHGRLYKVTEPDGATATYTYDVGNRLTRVDMTGASAQRREFLYDNRGFLTDEWHPEVGIAQPNGGWRRYSGLDAKGHALSIDTDDDGVAELAYTYDKAERLTLVREAQSGGANLLAYNYATDNSGTNKRKGRAELARRFNRLTVPWDPNQTQTVTVAETYEYRGPGGRVSKRVTNITPLGNDFDQSWSYDDLGNVTSIGYPNCTHSPCQGSAATRNLSQTFTRGRLTAIPGFSGIVTYHANGMVASVGHGNNTSETISVASHGMRRPHEIQINTGGNNLSLGIHSYDGAGNLYSRSGTAGTESYFYDQASRLKKFRLTSGNFEGYSYDAYGNLTRVDFFDGSTTTGTTFAVNSARNRLSAGMYDGRGNLEQWGGERYSYDALDAMTHRNFPSESYVYTADGERLANLRYTSGTSFGSETWTMRGLDGKVLRRWEHSLQPAGTLLFADGFETGNTSAWDTTVGAFASPPPSSSTASGMVAEIPTKGDFGGTQGTWLWTKDYIYRNGVMLAAATNESGNDATIHFAVNHLGTPQIITNAIGQINEIEHYWGFGGLAGNTEPGNETQRFTGHERDFHLNDNENDDLDYMHARYCSPHLRRFLSVDPARSSAKPGVPQSWNRYSYARNNPVKFVDPDGKIIETAWDAANVAAGVVSLVANLRSGRIDSAVIDSIGVALDTAATLAPFVAGGAAAGIAITRRSRRGGKQIAAPLPSQRAATREAKRGAGIPTSQQPVSQQSTSAGGARTGRQQTFQVAKTGGGTETMSVQVSRDLRGSHAGMPQVEAGPVKVRDGEVVTDNVGRPRIENEDKVRVDFDPRGNNE